MMMMDQFFVVLAALMLDFLSSSSSSDIGAPPRHFTSQPQAGTPEVLGKTKVLVCSADGTPDPSYRWMRDGRLMSAPKSASDAALKIRNIKQSDAGKYQCVATNAHGALLSGPAFVHVAYMKSFANHVNSEQYVSLGQAVVIDLPPIDCYPAPSIEWFDGSTALIPREQFFYHVTLKNQLVILEARQTLERKVFKARATNIYTQKTSDSQLFVIRVQNIGSTVGDVQPQIIISPSNVTATAGSDESAQLECVVNARPLSAVTIRWLRLVPATGVVETISADGVKYLKSTFERVLTILNPDASDAGTYRCEGSFRRQGSGAGAVGNTVMADARLTVHVMPSFLTSTDSEVSVEVDGDLTLPCDVTGSPHPSIRWYHNAEPINSLARRYSVMDNGSLVITHAMDDNSGVYQCFATSDAGDINAVTVVRIKSSEPVLLSVPYNRTVVSGDAVTLSCSSSGAPRPTLTWSRVVTAAMATRESVGISGVSQNDLTFDSVGVKDGGVYTCTASNSRGSVKMDVHLNVALRTRITTPSQVFTVHRGLAVMLPCEVISDTRFPVSWHWSFNGVSLDMTDIRHRQRMPDGSLHIRFSDRSDIGVYVCQVVSIGGNDSVTERLNVVEVSPPPTITSLTLGTASETSADLLWLLPTFNGNSEIRRFIVYFRILSQDNAHHRSSLHGAADDEQWKMIGQADGKSTGYTVHQLQPSQSYQFCVSAVNEVGEGKRSTPSSVLIIPQQAPSAPPRGVFGTPRSESAILVQWQAPEKSRWNGPLLGYQIRYKLAGYPDVTLRYENVTNVSRNVAEVGELQPFQEYDVAAAAYNEKGVGVFSDFTRVRTLEGRPVAPPVDVDAQPINSTSLSISWTPPHQRHINGITLGYRIVAVPDDGDFDTPEVTNVVNLNTSNLVGRQAWVLTALSKYTKYLVTVLCFTSKGDGPKSRPVAVQTLEDVPDRIESLTFGNKIDTRLEIFWTPPRRPNGVITGYLVKCRELNQSTWLVEVELPPRSINFTLMGLVAHKSYYVDVAAKTRIGVGASYVVVIESGVAPEKPEAPHEVVVKQIEATSVQLRVKLDSAQSPATLVQWIVEGECQDLLSPDQWKQLSVNSSAADNLLTVSGLHPDARYRFRVSAENSAGRGNTSVPTEWIRTDASVPSFPPERLVAHVLNATALSMIWTPLSQLHWNGRGRHYALRYWTCLGSNPDKLTLETDGGESVSIVVGDLEGWTSYCVQVAACNRLGCSEFGRQKSARTMESVPSSGPTDVTAETINSTSIHVTWSLVPEIHQNGHILGYRVRYRSTLESSDAVLTVWGKLRTSAVLTDLQKFTWYQITVVAFTRIGNGAGSFPVATTQTHEDVPGAPSGVYFPVANKSAVRVSWLPPHQRNGIITGYRIEYRAKKPNSSHPELSTSDESLGRDRNDYAVTELEANTFYTFAVSAGTRRGWGEAAVLDVYTGESRRVPVRPGRPLIGPSQIGDRWLTMTLLLAEVNNHSPIRNFTIQVRANGGQFMTHEELLPLGVNEFNISGLTPGVKYRLRLAASNDVGMSEFSEESDEVQTRFALPDHPPSAADLAQHSYNSVLVSWEPPNSDVAWNGKKSGYRVWYRQPNAYNEELRTTGIRNFDVDENLYQSVDIMYPATSALVSGLVPKAVFEVRVALVNNVGHGPMSSPVDIMLKEGVPSFVPGGLTAVALDSSSILVTWKSLPETDEEFENCLGYKVFYWAVESNGSTTQVKCVSLSENRVLVNELRMYTTYAFVVAVFGAGGDGQNSSIPVEARTEDGLPGPPEKLTVTVTSQTSVNLTWEQPGEPNGLIEGYELTYFQEKVVDGESKSVRVMLSSEKTSYHARDLMLGANYTFRISAKTRLGLGSEASSSILVGSQIGSPEAPNQLACSESDEEVVVTWNTPNSGSSPIIAYILEYRNKDSDLDSAEWISIRKDPLDRSSLESQTTIGLHLLVPRAKYEFRVFAVNSQGISLPSSTAEYTFNGEMRTHTEPVSAPQFYQRWWFLVAVGFAGFAVVVAVVAAFCISGRKRAKIASKEKSWKKRNNGESKPLPPLVDDATGFATIERRHPQLWGNQKYPKATTLPLYTRAPPRPSPGSILYDTDVISQHEDSGNVSDKASQNGDSDCENEANHLAAFLNQSSKRPQSLCGATAPDAPAYTISLNGGHSVMPKYHTMRPTKLTSFV